MKNCTQIDPVVKQMESPEFLPAYFSFSSDFRGKNASVTFFVFKTIIIYTKFYLNQFKKKRISLLSFSPIR